MTSLTHRYVDVIPPQLEDGVLYVCEKYETVVHRCCCGCGAKTVTPISPTDWRLIKHGSTVSLYPSIGNWSLPCRSHYWIRKNGVLWAEDWSQTEIDANRALDRNQKRQYYQNINKEQNEGTGSTNTRGEGFWTAIARWLS